MHYFNFHAGQIIQNGAGYQFCLMNMMGKKINLQQILFLICCGLLASGILLELGLRVGGLTFLFLQNNENTRNLKHENRYHIMCIGESTTAMQWPGQLEQILNDKAGSVI